MMRLPQRAVAVWKGSRQESLLHAHAWEASDSVTVSEGRGSGRERESGPVVARSERRGSVTLRSVTRLI
jgi:hypothetical protein